MVTMVRGPKMAAKTGEFARIFTILSDVSPLLDPDVKAHTPTELFTAAAKKTSFIGYFCSQKPFNYSQRNL